MRPNSLGMNPYPLQYPAAHGFVAGLELLHPPLAGGPNLLPPRVILQQGLALARTLGRIRPEHGFHAFLVHGLVLGGALGAQQAARVGHFQRPLRVQVPVALGGCWAIKV